MPINTQNPNPLSPIETELLSLVSGFEARLSQLENSLSADAATAQSQRQSIADKLEALTKRLVSLEQLLPALKVLAESLGEFRKQCDGLHELCGMHAQNYNRAIAAFKEMQRVWQEQLAAYKVLGSQVAQLTAALRSLGA